jgi:CheY-like chemotaxis protein
VVRAFAARVPPDSRLVVVFDPELVVPDPGPLELPARNLEGVRVVASDQALPQPMPMPIETSQQSGELAGVRVLVVDDDAACRRAYRRLLEFAGATVETAAGAQQGLATFYRMRPHVVVSDLVMPGEDGCWLMGRILAAVGGRGRRPRGVVVTGHSDERERVRCLAAGFDAFLTKPVDPIVLSDVVARLARDAALP